MSMTPRERVLAALDHKVPDRIPLDFWAVPEVWEKLYDHLGTRDPEAVQQALHSDIRAFEPDYIGPPLRKMPDGTFYDRLGTHRRLVNNGFCTYDEYASFPVADIEDVSELDDYEWWPNPDHYDYEGLSKKIGNAHDTYYIKLETGGIYEFAWALRGMEQFMIDMLTEPEIAAGIMNRLTDFFCEYIRRCMEAAGDKFDMVYTYDDIASQNGLLFSKELWRELVRPCHERLNKVIHSYGKKVMYHSCGAVYPLIGELADNGMDVLNPLQPLAAGMDFTKIKTEFGKRLCFHGGIDIQQMLPHGTPDEVRAAVRSAIDRLGPDGYILTSAHHIQADTPVENILAMYDEAVKYPLG